MLARSIGRRAAHRGFKVDLRYGNDFVSVQRVAGDEPAVHPKAAKAR